MSNIKRKIRTLKRKFGMSMPLVGALTLGTVSNSLFHKDNTHSQTEVASNPQKEMTAEEKCDTIVISALLMTEGCSLDAYKDDVGIWTYGIGNTKTIDGKRVKEGDFLKNYDEAYATAKHHVAEEIDFVFDYIKRDLKPEQKAALKLFAYNCGANTLVDDGKLTKLGQAVNDGNDDFVIKEMLTYRHGGKTFMKGLFFRRVFEAYLYQGFISVDDIEKCIIGGIYSASHNPEMNDIFKLRKTKIKVGKRFKIKTTCDDTAVTDSNVAKKLIAICQTPIEGPISAKYANCHMGEQISEFLPQNLKSNTYIIDENVLANINQGSNCLNSSIKTRETEQVASIAPDLRALIKNITNFKE